MPNDGREFVFPHISISEGSCKCGQTKCNMGVDPKHYHPKLVAAFRKLRAKVGGPLYINSCCRCWYDNTRGMVERGGRQGHPNSLHLNGRAMDVTTRGKLTGEELAKLAREVPEIGGIGIGRTWIHFDVGSKSQWYYYDKPEPKKVAVEAPKPVEVPKRKPIIKTRLLPKKGKK